MGSAALLAAAIEAFGEAAFCFKSPGLGGNLSVQERTGHADEGVGGVGCDFVVGWSFGA